MESAVGCRVSLIGGRWARVARVASFLVLVSLGFEAQDGYSKIYDWVRIDNDDIKIVKDPVVASDYRLNAIRSAEKTIDLCLSWKPLRRRS